MSSGAGAESSDGVMLTVYGSVQPSKEEPHRGLIALERGDRRWVSCTHDCSVKNRGAAMQPKVTQPGIYEDWPDHLGLPDRDNSIVVNTQEHPQSNILTECLLPKL